MSNHSYAPRYPQSAPPFAGSHRPLGFEEPIHMPTAHPYTNTSSANIPQPLPYIPQFSANSSPVYPSNNDMLLHTLMHKQLQLSSQEAELRDAQRDLQKRETLKEEPTPIVALVPKVKNSLSSIQSSDTLTPEAINNLISLSKDPELLRKGLKFVKIDGLYAIEESLSSTNAETKNIVEEARSQINERESQLEEKQSSPLAPEQSSAQNNELSEVQTKKSIDFLTSDLVETLQNIHNHAHLTPEVLEQLKEISSTSQATGKAHPLLHKALNFIKDDGLQALVDIVQEGSPIEQEAESILKQRDDKRKIEQQEQKEAQKKLEFQQQRKIVDRWKQKTHEKKHSAPQQSSELLPKPMLATPLHTPNHTSTARKGKITASTNTPNDAVPTPPNSVKPLVLKSLNTHTHTPDYHERKEQELLRKKAEEFEEQSEIVDGWHASYRDNSFDILDSLVELLEDENSITDQSDYTQNNDMELLDQVQNTVENMLAKTMNTVNELKKYHPTKSSPDTHLRKIYNDGMNIAEKLLNMVDTINNMKERLSSQDTCLSDDTIEELDIMLPKLGYIQSEFEQSVNAAINISTQPKPQVAQPKPQTAQPRPQTEKQRPPHPDNHALINTAYSVSQAILSRMQKCSAKISEANADPDSIFGPYTPSLQTHLNNMATLHNELATIQTTLSSQNALSQPLLQETDTKLKSLIQSFRQEDATLNKTLHTPSHISDIPFHTPNAQIPPNHKIAFEYNNEHKCWTPKIKNESQLHYHVLKENTYADKLERRLDDLKTKLSKTSEDLAKSINDNNNLTAIQKQKLRRIKTSTDALLSCSKNLHHLISNLEESLNKLTSRADNQSMKFFGSSKHIKCQLKLQLAALEIDAMHKVGHVLQQKFFETDKDVERTHRIDADEMAQISLDTTMKPAPNPPLTEKQQEKLSSISGMINKLQKIPNSANILHGSSTIHVLIDKLDSKYVTPPTQAKPKHADIQPDSPLVKTLTANQETIEQRYKDINDKQDFEKHVTTNEVLKCVYAGDKIDQSFHKKILEHGLPQKAKQPKKFPMGKNTHTTKKLRLSEDDLQARSSHVTHYQDGSHSTTIAPAHSTKFSGINGALYTPSGHSDHTHAGAHSLLKAITALRNMSHNPETQHLLPQEFKILQSKISQETSHAMENIQDLTDKLIKVIDTGNNSAGEHRKVENILTSDRFAEQITKCVHTNHEILPLLTKDVYSVSGISDGEPAIPKLGFDVVLESALITIWKHAQQNELPEGLQSLLQKNAAFISPTGRFLVSSSQGGWNLIDDNGVMKLIVKALEDPGLRGSIICTSLRKQFAENISTWEAVKRKIIKTGEIQQLSSDGVLEYDLPETQSEALKAIDAKILALKHTAATFHTKAALCETLSALDKASAESGSGDPTVYMNSITAHIKRSLDGFGTNSQIENFRDSLTSLFVDKYKELFHEGQNTNQILTFTDVMMKSAKYFNSLSLARKSKEAAKFQSEFMKLVSEASVNAQLTNTPLIPKMGRETEMFSDYAQLSCPSLHHPHLYQKPKPPFDQYEDLKNWYDLADQNPEEQILSKEIKEYMADHPYDLSQEMSIFKKLNVLSSSLKTLEYEEPPKQKNTQPKQETPSSEKAIEMVESFDSPITPLFSAPMQHEWDRGNNSSEPPSPLML